MPPEVMRKAKQLGFSDKQIALAVQRWVQGGLTTLKFFVTIRNN